MTRVAPTGDMRCANDGGSAHVTPPPRDLTTSLEKPGKVDRYRVMLADFERQVQARARESAFTQLYLWQCVFGQGSARTSTVAMKG